MQTCRDIKSLFTHIREKTSRAMNFAKLLRKDLEIAAEFKITSKPKVLLEELHRGGHVLVSKISYLYFLVSKNYLYLQTAILKLKLTFCFTISMFYSNSYLHAK